MILSQGYFLRNGPDLRHEPLVEDVHWFDGDGYVHLVRLHGGEGEREGEGENQQIAFAEYGGQYVETQVRFSLPFHPSLLHLLFCLFVILTVSPGRASLRRRRQERQSIAG